MIEPKNYTQLTPSERKTLREEYVKDQGGLCYHCKGDLKKPAMLNNSFPLNMKLFPAGFLRHPVHLHHCHKTGMTIGAVHSFCNGVLWQYFGE